MPEKADHRSRAEIGVAALAGNPATNEIEITPEMIAAGVEEFCSYDGRFEGPEDIVAQIFLRMLSVRRVQAGQIR